MKLVPDWIRAFGSEMASGPARRPSASYGAGLSPSGDFSAFLSAGKTIAAASLLYLCYGLWLLPVLTDWISFAVDEGFVSYGAQRVISGEIPHKDFFFLWTPGTIWLHALLQLLGGGWLVERGAALLAASLSAGFTLAWARRLGLSVAVQIFAFLLICAWGFTLWNIPYSSWYAYLIVLAASYLLPSHARSAGILFGLGFWFKQNIGIFSFLGAAAALWVLHEKQALKRLLLFGGLSLMCPFLYFIKLGAFSAAFSQIFLFPLQYRNLMGLSLNFELLAGPLTCLGLWIFSLYLIRKGEKGRGTMLLLQGSLIGYSAYRWLHEGNDFVFGAFFLLSLLAIPAGIVVLLDGRAKGNKKDLCLYFLPGLGAFLQIYPRFDFQHFLFVFPTAALLLALFFDWLIQRYPQKPVLWIYVPLLFLFLMGVPKQIGINILRLYGSKDPYGRISTGEARALNEEMRAVGNLLRERGLNAGDPVLVFPNATHFYFLENFRNPTPHLQFFPGYVEAFHDRQIDILPKFQNSGGRYIVFQKRSGTEKNVPDLYRDFLTQYRLFKDFPVHFSVWEKKPW